ncbi:dTMP kinase [uncultured Hyphomonas sp.]|uniref:dTMP kinase n=1 Tax=uncultured Hyphomonas sp. TaxID=225298 RepID=UPI002AAB7170|nr:dTMP kinase [uncultured Hyphomonas sp.]
MTEGRFITLEGGEGTGKSTLLAALRGKLEAAGYSVVVTREPGGTELAETIRNLVLHPPEGQVWSSMAVALLMNAARTDHLEKMIRPAITAGTWVLCDRFADSTRVYQSVQKGVSVEVLKMLERSVLGDTRPDLTLVLDAPVELAASRRAERGGQVDAFEMRDQAFHEAVRQAFLDVAKDEPSRCAVLDASRTAEDVATQAWKAIESRLFVEKQGAPS